MVQTPCADSHGLFRSTTVHGILDHDADWNPKANAIFLQKRSNYPRPQEQRGVYVNNACRHNDQAPFSCKASGVHSCRQTIMPPASSIVVAPLAVTIRPLKYFRHAHRHPNRPVQTPRTNRRGRHGCRLCRRADRAGQAQSRAKDHQAWDGQQKRRRSLSRPNAKPWP